MPYWPTRRSAPHSWPSWRPTASIGIFLYLPAAEGLAPSAGFIPFDGERVGPLVADLRARGALTYALDGDPEYVRPENHDGVLQTVRRIEAHNRSAPPEQRFFGVRYDVEPYLVRGFQGTHRAEILDGYVRLIADAADAAHEGRLAFGVDIPFWLDEPDEATGAVFEAQLDGHRQPVLDHVLSHVDDVAIMAYRTVAGGPNGVISHSAFELARASEAGVGVFVGVETTRIFDETFHTVRGTTRRGLPTLDDARWVVVERLAGGRARVWLAEGAGALAAIADATDGGDSLSYWFAGNQVALLGSTISFQSLGPEAFENVGADILSELAGEASSRGLAYHDYLGLNALLR